MNLHSNFSIKYIKFSGDIHKEKGILYYFSFLGKGEEEKCINLSIFELSKVFDVFYGGKIQTYNINEEENVLVLKDIPLRALYFSDGIYDELVAIGHVQKDIWICRAKNELVTEKVVVQNFINNYLLTTFKVFPRRIDKFLPTLKDNSYEISKLIKDNNIDVLDYWTIFEKIAKKYIEKLN